MATPPAVPQQTERRICSVLFVDLVGFTTVSESRDPEDVRTTLAGYFDLARRVVERYDGTLEKFIGDAVVAVWGAPSAHGDDAVRAVRAALDIVRDVPTAVPSTGGPLQARGGVVTGAVAVTVGAVGQGIVAGDVVNTAARVQATARPGEVLVDPATRQASAAVVTYDAAGRHELKGKAEGLELFAAVDVAPRTEDDESATLALRGRSHEARVLVDAFADCVAERRARSVRIVGVAGIGKSRLVAELRAEVDALPDTILWHSGRCVAYGEGVAYWALAQIVRLRLGIREDDPAEAVHRKLDDGLARWIPDADDRTYLGPRLGALLGVTDPGLRREELFAGWRLWFERLAEHAPVVLIIEDMQWADTGLLDFCDHLLEWAADAAIFVVGLARPELLERRPDWTAGRRRSTSILLEPLSDGDVRDLLHELVPSLDSTARDRVVEQANGIPLYAVELVRALADRGVLERVGDAYRVAQPVTALDVPASLTSLIAARIDGLPADERALIASLSVLGTSFARSAVAAVSDAPAADVDRLLSSLVRREILAVRTDHRSPELGQYVFTQLLLRTVAYDTLSRADRKQRHLAVVAHLRQTDENDEFAEFIAQHYRDALQAVPADDDVAVLRAEAIRAYDRAAVRADAVGAPDSAVAHWLTACELTEDPRERNQFLERAAKTAAMNGRPVRSIELYERLLADSDPSDARELARLHSEMFFPLCMAGHFEEAMRRVDAAFEVVRDGPRDETFARVVTRSGGARVFTADRETALDRIDQGLALAQALDIPELLVEAALHRGILFGLQDRTAESLVYFRWVIDLADAHNLATPLRNALGCAGDLCMTSDIPGAEEYLLRGTAIAREHGDRYAESFTIGNLALVRLFEGRWTELDELIARFAPDEDIQVAAFLVLRGALLEAWRGHPAEARRHLDRLTHWAASEDLQERMLYVAADAAVLMAEGRLDDAVDLGIEGLGPAVEALGCRHEAIRVLWPQVVDAALLAGRTAEAARLVDQVAGRPVGNLPPFFQAQLLRYRARLEPADATAEQVERWLRESCERLAELGYPYHLALAEIDLAGWLRDRQRVEESVAVADSASTRLTALGAQPALQRARRIREQQAATTSV